MGGEPGARERRLPRRLGLLDATALALGAIIGAGIFVVVGEAAGAAGALLPVAVVLGAAAATLNGLSAAELGVNFPRAGGGYEFGYQVIGPLVGFLEGWIFLLAGVAASTTYTLTFARYLNPLFPGLSPRPMGVALALGAVLVGVLGVRLSARVNNVLVAFKILVLLVFVVLGLQAWDARNFAPLAPSRAGGVLLAGALLFFGFTGYARPVTVVEEITDPRRNLPRAVMLALGSTLVLYMAVAVVALGLVGPEALASSSAPLRDALRPTGSVAGVFLMSLGALVATASVLLTEIWGLSRLAFAMARRHDLPDWLGRLSDPGSVPRNAVLAVGLIVAALTALVDLRPALEASSLALLVYYGVINVAALRLGPRRQLYPRFLPALGVIACTLLAFSLPPATLLIVAAVAAVGIAYFHFVRPRLA